MDTTWDPTLEEHNRDQYEYYESLPTEEPDSDKSKSKEPDTMQACMALATKVLPGLVEEPSTQAASSQSNLTMLLGLAKKLENPNASRFSSPGLVSESLATK